jgi:hypothetical protein
MLVTILTTDDNLGIASCVEASVYRPYYRYNDRIFVKFKSLYEIPEKGKTYSANIEYDWVTKNGKAMLTHGIISSMDTLDGSYRYDINKKGDT